MKRIKNNNKHGFTLTEMILVVAIIVILAGALLINLSSVLQRTQEKSDEQTELYNQNVSAKTSENEDRLQGYGFGIAVAVGTPAPTPEGE